MKASEATTMKEWEEADHTPTYQAAKTTAGGFLPTDIMLQMCTTIVCDFPKAEFLQNVTLEFEATAGSEPALLMAASFQVALMRKHLSSIDSHGNRKNAQEVAREVIIDILAHKDNWKSYSSIFAAFAERNDQRFFEQLVRGKERKRKPVFSPVEVYCLSNWHGWNDARFAPVATAVPPLKYWTAAAVLGLIDVSATEAGVTLRFGEKGLYEIWNRLGLKQIHPAKVSGLFPVRDQLGQFKVIQTE